MVAFFILNIILFIFILKRNGLRNSDLVVLTYYIAFIFGIPGSYLALDGSDWWLREISHNAIYESYVIYNLTILLFAITVFSRRKITLQKEIIVINNSTIERYIFTGIILISLSVTLIFLLPDSPLAQLILYQDTDALLLAELRGSLGVDYSGSILIIYFQNLVLRYFLPYVTIYFCLVYHLSGQDRKLYIFSLAALIFCAAIDLSKAPIILSILLIILARYVINRISISIIMRYLSIAFITLAFLYAVVMGAEGSEIFLNIAHRIFIAQYVGLPVTIEVFPRIHDYIDLGSTLGIIGKTLGFNYEFYSRINMEYVNPDGVLAGTAGYLATFALAEGYAINGMIGYILTGIILYLFLSRLVAYFSKKQDIKWVSFYILLLLKMPLMIMDSASAMILNYGLILMYIILILIDSLSNKTKIVSQTILIDPSISYKNKGIV